MTQSPQTSTAVDTILRQFRQHICNGLMSDTPNSMTFEESSQAIAALIRDAKIEELEPIYNLWHEEGGRKIGQYVKDRIKQLTEEVTDDA